MTFGSHGDVLPFLAIGRELARRGHAVTLAAPPSFAERAAAAGLPFHPLGDASAYEAVNAQARLWDARAGAGLLFALAVRLVEPALAFVRAATAGAGDALVLGSSLSFGARFAGEAAGLRTVTAHLSPFLVRSRYAPPALPGLAFPAWWPPALVDAVQSARDRFLVDPRRLPPLNALRARLGLPPIVRLTDWLNAADGVLLLFPDWFAPPQPDWPPTAVQTGFPRGGRPIAGEAERPALDARLGAFLDAGEAPIAFTCGTSMEHGHAFFASAAAACARLGRRGVLLTARAEQVPAQRPASVHHADYVPLAALLPRCAALVHHGGVGTLAEALAAGVPQLVVPGAFDQFDHAARIARLGLGARLARDRLTPGTGAEALARLLAAPDVAAACGAVRARMASADGVGAACDALERMGAAPGR